MWSNLAHEMTAEFRGLCAEEAYLQQELEKLHDLRNKVKLEGELWDELVSSSSQNSHMVQRATRLWDSLLSRKSQHEVLASGPIEDLIAHREHRYRISGSSLLAAMDQSSLVTPSELGSSHSDKNEQIDGSQASVNGEKQKSSLDSTYGHGNDEKFLRVEDRSGRGQPTVDIAEVLRRWTHALQRIHKQSLQLAKANDGEGPELLRNNQEGDTSGHAESLAATLAEHKQHLASIQVLINQLKEVAPAIQNSVSELTDEVNSLSSSLLPLAKHRGRSNSPIQAQNSGRTLENSTDEVGDMTSRLSTIQLEKTSASPPTLKLPHLFSLTPNSGKGGNMQKRQSQAQANQMGNMPEQKALEQPASTNHIDYLAQDNDNFFIQNLKRSVREAALSFQSYGAESSQDSRSDDSSEHYFVPLPGTGLSRITQDKKPNLFRNKRLFTSQADSTLPATRVIDNRIRNNFDGAEILNDLESLEDYDDVNGFLSAVGSNSSVSDAHRSFYDLDDVQDQVFSPPLLMDTSLLADSYEDLLAPLSETETALMEH